jgi:Tol biopolymer transport system component
LSPDGLRLVAISNTPQGSALWLRRLDQVTGQTLAGNTGVTFPFWSPDGRFIAFFASGKLNKVDVFGGPAQPLCDAPTGRGGTWNGDGLILFSPSDQGPLFTVPAAGGIPVQVTELDKARGDGAHRYPKFLPDGRHFLFFVASAKPEIAGLYLGTLDSKATRRLVASDAMGVFAPPNYLLFMRGTTLMAQRFDLRRLELDGDPFPIAPNVGINTGNRVSGIAVSDNGVLAYRVGGNATDRIVRWVVRTGKPLGDVGAAGPRENVSLAPGSERLAETRFDGSTGDIWIVDLQRGSGSRFTFDPAIDDNAIWSPDGTRIVFASTRDDVVRNLYVKNAGGAGQEELLL